MASATQEALWEQLLSERVMPTGAGGATFRGQESRRPALPAALHTGLQLRRPSKSSQPRTSLETTMVGARESSKAFEQERILSELSQASAEASTAKIRSGVICLDTEGEADKAVSVTVTEDEAWTSEWAVGRGREAEGLEATPILTTPAWPWSPTLLPCHSHSLSHTDGEFTTF